MDDGAAAHGAPQSSGETSRALGAVVQRRLTTFDPASGVPVVQNVPMMTPEQIKNLAPAALSLPYEDPLDMEPQYKGMTCGEVMMAKRAQRAAASGDDAQSESLLDRAIGKPESSSKSVNVNLSGNYEGYLAEKARKARESPREEGEARAPIDAEVVRPVDPLDLG